MIDEQCSVSDFTETDESKGKKINSRPCLRRKEGNAPLKLIRFNSPQAVPMVDGKKRAFL